MLIEKINWDGHLEADRHNDLAFYEQSLLVGTDAEAVTLHGAQQVTLQTVGTTGAYFRFNQQNAGLTQVNPDYAGIAQVLRNELTGTMTLGGNFNVIISGDSFNNGTEVTVVTALAGTKQVETATATGTVTTGGNASCVVTSGLVTGSPLAVPFVVEEADEAAEIADACRAALNATAAITAHYTVGGTGATITLTAKLCAENDASLNIALDDGSGEGASEGVGTVASSANTTAGVALDTIASALGKIVTSINADETAGAFLTASAVSDKYLTLTLDTPAANDESLVASYENDTTVGFLETDSTITVEGDAPGDDLWFDIPGTSSIEINPPAGRIKPFTFIYLKAPSANIQVLLQYWGTPGGAIVNEVPVEE